MTLNIQQIYLAEIFDKIIWEKYSGEIFGINIQEKYSSDLLFINYLYKYSGEKFDENIQQLRVYKYS